MVSAAVAAASVKRTDVMGVWTDVMGGGTLVLGVSVAMTTDQRYSNSAG